MWLMPFVERGWKGSGRRRAFREFPLAPFFFPLNPFLWGSFCFLLLVCRFFGIGFFFGVILPFALPPEIEAELLDIWLSGGMRTNSQVWPASLHFLHGPVWCLLRLHLKPSPRHWLHATNFLAGAVAWA
jgi:hypothetical protein